MIGRIFAAAAASLGGYVAYQLFLQNGRLLLRVEALEQRVAELTVGSPPQDGVAGGLPAGSVVLDFALPALSGGTVTLSQWGGRRVLLIFFDPTCSFCRQMLPDLASLEPDPDDGRPVPIMISTGDLQENRRLMDEHGVRCTVLLQEDGEVAQLYQVTGTPAGYLVDERGKTASTQAAGAQAILALARGRAGAELAANGQTPAEAKGKQTVSPGNGSLAASRINRSGLTAGTPAPPFRLPRVDGGELALDEFRGRPVLLVFSDPQCGPCNELVPKLEKVRRRTPALQVLMVSRGEPEVNRAKIAEQGVTFPVVLQRNWDTSREYGMFATPIGYLIDEHGVIAADVAVGADAILALARLRVDGNQGNGGAPMHG